MRQRSSVRSATPSRSDTAEGVSSFCISVDACCMAASSGSGAAQAGELRRLVAIGVPTSELRASLNFEIPVMAMLQKKSGPAIFREAAQWVMMLKGLDQQSIGSARLAAAISCCGAKCEYLAVMDTVAWPSS